jgi:hypothetical protein
MNATLLTHVVRGAVDGLGRKFPAYTFYAPRLDSHITRIEFRKNSTDHWIKLCTALVTPSNSCLLYFADDTYRYCEETTRVAELVNNTVDQQLLDAISNKFYLWDSIKKITRILHARLLK